MKFLLKKWARFWKSYLHAHAKTMTRSAKQHFLDIYSLFSVRDSFYFLWYYMVMYCQKRSLTLSTRTEYFLNRNLWWYQLTKGWQDWHIKLQTGKCWKTVQAMTLNEKSLFIQIAVYFDRIFVLLWKGPLPLCGILVLVWIEFCTQPCPLSPVFGSCR